MKIISNNVGKVCTVFCETGFVQCCVISPLSGCKHYWDLWISIHWVPWCLLHINSNSVDVGCFLSRTIPYNVLWSLFLKYKNIKFHKTQSTPYSSISKAYETCTHKMLHFTSYTDHPTHNIWMVSFLLTYATTDLHYGTKIVLRKKKIKIAAE